MLRVKAHPKWRSLAQLWEALLERPLGVARSFPRFCHSEVIFLPCHQRESGTEVADSLGGREKKICDHFRAATNLLQTKGPFTGGSLCDLAADLELGRQTWLPGPGARASPPSLWAPSPPPARVRAGPGSHCEAVLLGRSRNDRGSGWVCVKGTSWEMVRRVMCLTQTSFRQSLESRFLSWSVLFSWSMQ